MIGKKDNHDIFNQYKRVLLEQVEEYNISSLINRVKVSPLDGKTKSEILDLLSDKTVQDIYKMVSLRKNSGFVDQDTANPQDPKFADEMLRSQMDQDDTKVVNEPDPKFAEELAKARKEQQEKYPEKEESEENGYTDPSSFFSGPTTPISQMGSMKFEPRVTPKVKTPQEKAEEEAYWGAKEQENKRRKLEQINLAKANRKTSLTSVPDEKIGASPLDPDYNVKKARWLAAFAAGAGRS
jgi:hypothetical protein